MHAYQYKDTQVFTDNLQEEYLGKKSLGWFMGFFTITCVFFIRARENWDLGLGFGTGLKKGVVFVVIVNYQLEYSLQDNTQLKTCDTCT